MRADPLVRRAICAVSRAIGGGTLDGCERRWPECAASASEAQAVILDSVGRTRVVPASQIDLVDEDATRAVNRAAAVIAQRTT
jgi:hypothetical protein